MSLGRARANFARAEAASLIFLLINEGRRSRGATGIFAEWNFCVGGMRPREKAGTLRLVT